MKRFETFRGLLSIAVVLLAATAAIASNVSAAAPETAAAAAPPPPLSATTPSPSSAQTAWKPVETADAVLHVENVSWGRQLHDALRLPDWFDIAVDHRDRFEFLDDPWRPGESRTQTQIVERSRLRIGIDAPGGIRLLGEFQDARIFNDRPNDFRLNAVDHLDVLQLFVSATRKNLFGRGLRFDAHAGRLTLDLGSRRLLARNDFRNTVNAFDGLHLQLGGDDRKWRVRAFYVLPVAVRDSDLMNNRPSTRRRFWGVAFEDLRNPWLQLDVAYLGLEDLPGNRSYRTYDLRLYRRPAPAQIDYEGEIAAQFGERGTATADRDQSAWMTHVELGYTLGVPWSPRLAAQLDYASGNDDPSDDDSHAFDALYGARRFDLMPTGIFGAFRRTNILSPGVRFGLQPSKTIRLDVKVRYWMLDEARDAFAGTAGPGGGALTDASGNAGRDLGTDLELRARWDAREWLAFDVGYDHWWKGRYLDEVANARTQGDADYFYLQSRVRF
ncbi:alginate export family protein [Myxococcota bacterium]|nr:alginate export family protein [Myxococcota bacterium]